MALQSLMEGLKWGGHRAGQTLHHAGAFLAPGKVLLGSIWCSP